MLTKGMCVDWAKYGIQINGIAPGYFATEMNRALVENKEFSDWLCKRTPAGRWGNVDELCGTAVFLASKASTFINGQIIYVDWWPYQLRLVSILPLCSAPPPSLLGRTMTDKEQGGRSGASTGNR